MAITKEKKLEIVDTYLERLQGSHALIMAEYRGMTVQQLQTLRGRMREHGVAIQVAKNTLFKLALTRVGMPVPEDLLAGPTAVVFLADDIAASTKALLDSSKDLDAFVIKGGVLETQILDAEGAKGLRNLPGRGQVLAQLLGAIQAPSSELVRTLQAPAGELFRTLQAPLRELALTIQAHADKGNADASA